MIADCGIKTFEQSNARVHGSEVQRLEFEEDNDKNESAGPKAANRPQPKKAAPACRQAGITRISRI
jgi:hypothetical protein